MSHLKYVNDALRESNRSFLKQVQVASLFLLNFSDNASQVMHRQTWQRFFSFDLLRCTVTALYILPPALLRCFFYIEIKTEYLNFWFQTLRKDCFIFAALHCRNPQNIQLVSSPQLKHKGLHNIIASRPEKITYIVQSPIMVLFIFTFLRIVVKDCYNVLRP